ncbi:hypothetical protein C0J52_10218 [Blattella germanica]|nr:hypothetical protein C0J52_10218 [Blattella germanica]
MCSLFLWINLVFSLSGMRRLPLAVIAAILTTAAIKTDPFKNNRIMDLQSVNCSLDPSSSKSALETVGNLLTRLGQTPGDNNNNARPTETGVSPQVPPTSCQKLDLRVMGELVTERGCAGPVQNKLNPCDAIKLLATHNLELEYCGFCNNDNCNPASNIGASTLVLAASPILFLMNSFL